MYTYNFQTIPETAAENLILALESLKIAMVNSKTQQHNSPESTTTHAISDIIVSSIDEVTNLIKASSPQHQSSKADDHFSQQPHKRHPSHGCSPAKKRVRNEGSKIMETAETVADALSK